MTKKETETSNVTDIMSDKEPDNIRDKNGNFLPGNPLWRLYAWKPGNEANPNKFTPEELRDLIIEYVEIRTEENKTLTLSGLRVHLGISRQSLYDYAHGKFGKTDQDKWAYTYVLDQFNGYMEDEAESKLDREHGSVEGLKFRMKNMWPNYWKDSKHLSVDTNEVRTIQIIVDPSSPLAKRLAQRDCVQAIEHTGEGEL